MDATRLQQLSYIKAHFPLTDSNLGPRAKTGWKEGKEETEGGDMRDREDEVEVNGNGR